MSFSRTPLSRFNELSMPKECRSEYRHLYQLLGFCVFGELSEWARSFSEILTFMNIFRILASSLRSSILTLQDTIPSGIKSPSPGKELIKRQQQSLIQQSSVSMPEDPDKFQTLNTCLSDTEMKSYRPAYKEEKMGKKDFQGDFYTKRTEASDSPTKGQHRVAFGVTTSTRGHNYVQDHNVRTLESQFEAKRKRFTTLKKELQDRQKTALQLYNGMADLREKLLNATGKDLGTLEEVKVMDIGQMRESARSRDWSETGKRQQNQMQDVAVGEGLLERSMWAGEMATCQKTSSGSTVTHPTTSEMLLEWEERLRSVPITCLGMCRQVVAKRNLLLMLITGLAEDESGDGLSLEAEVQRQLVNYQREADDFDKELEQMQESQMRIVSELVGVVRRMDSVPKPLRTEKETSMSEFRNPLKEENEEKWELQDQIEQLTETLTKERALRDVLSDETKMLETQLKKTTARMRDVENKLSVAENGSSLQNKQDDDRDEKLSRVMLRQLEQERDELAQRVSELKEAGTRMENEATVVILDLKKQFEEVNTLLQEKTELSERLHCDLQDVRERLTEVENSIANPRKHVETSDKETQVEDDMAASNPETLEKEKKLMIELQSVSVLLRSANSQLIEIEEENLRLQNSASLSEEREQYLENKVQSILEEMKQKDEQLEEMFKDNRMLNIVISYNQEQFKEYEKRVSNLYAKAGSVMTQDDSTKQLQQQLKQQAEELHRVVESLQSKLKVVETQNEELEQNVVHRQLEVELRDRAIRRQTRALRSRDEQLVGLKSALEKKEVDTQKSCEEMESKREELHSLYLTLEFKEDQVQRLEKQVKQLEEKKALQECELQLRRANHKACRVPRQIPTVPSKQVHYRVNSPDTCSNYSRNNVYGHEVQPITRYRFCRPSAELASCCDGMRFRNYRRALYDGRGKQVSKYHSQIIIPTRPTNTYQDIPDIDPIVFTSDGLIKYIPVELSSDRLPLALNYSTNTLDKMGNVGDFTMREKGSELVTKLFYVDNTDKPKKDKIGKDGNSVMRNDFVENINYPIKYINNRKADIAVEPVRCTTNEKLHLYTNMYDTDTYDSKINTPTQPVRYGSDEEFYPHSHSSDGYINDNTTDPFTHGLNEQCHIPINNPKTDTKSRTEDKSVINKNDEQQEQCCKYILRRIDEDQPSKNVGQMDNDERQRRSWPYCTNVVLFPKEIRAVKEIPVTLPDEIEREPVKMNTYKEVIAKNVPVYNYEGDVNAKKNVADKMRINNLGISRSLSPYTKFKTKVNSEGWLQRKNQLARRMRKVELQLAENGNKFQPVNNHIKNIQSNIYEGKRNMQLNSGCDFKLNQTLDECTCGSCEKRMFNSTHGEKSEIIPEPVVIGDGNQECATDTPNNYQKTIDIHKEVAKQLEYKMGFQKFLENFWLDPNMVDAYRKAKPQNALRNMDLIRKTLKLDSDPILKYSNAASNKNITSSILKDEECKLYNNQQFWTDVITNFVHVGNKQKLCTSKEIDEERENLAKIIPFLTEPKSSHTDFPIKTHDNLHAEKETNISKENVSGTNNHVNNILLEGKKEEQNPTILLKRDAENDNGSRPSRSLCKYTVRSTRIIRDDSLLRQKLRELKMQAQGVWPYHETAREPQLLEPHLQNTNESEESSHEDRLNANESEESSHEDGLNANESYHIDNSMATVMNDTASYFKTLPLNTTKDSFKSSNYFNKQCESFDQDYCSNVTAQPVIKDQSLNKLQPRCDYQHLQSQFLAPNTTMKKPQSDPNNSMIQQNNSHSQWANTDNFIINQKPTNDKPVSSDTTNKKSCFHSNINRKTDKPKQISWGNKIYYLDNDDISYNSTAKLSNSSVIPHTNTTPNLSDVASVTNLKSTPNSTKSMSIVKNNENLVCSQNKFPESASDKSYSKTNTSHVSVNNLNSQSKISSQSPLSSETDQFLKEISQKELDSILEKLNVVNSPSKQTLKNIQDEAAIHTQLSWIQMQENQCNDSQWSDEHHHVYQESHTSWPSHYEDPDETEYCRESNCRGHWIVQQTLTDYSSSIESETEFYCSMPQCPCVHMYDTDVSKPYKVRRALNVSTQFWEACGY